MRILRAFRRRRRLTLASTPDHYRPWFVGDSECDDDNPDCLCAWFESKKDALDYIEARGGSA